MTEVTQPKFKIKVPQTLDQAAKLRKWLEQIAHKTSLPARNFVSNLIYQIKATESEADLAGVPQDYIQQAATHSDPATTRRYIRGPQVEKIANMQRGRIEYRARMTD